MSDDDKARRTLLDRANRMLNQSKILRKMADELLQESNDIRGAVPPKKKRNGNTRAAKKSN